MGARRAVGMKVAMVLPALTEATSPYFRPFKYSLSPPPGLATLAGYLRDDEVRIWDEHVQRLRLDDDRPDLVVIQPYITSARRSYGLADAYFYRWGSIWRGAATKELARDQLRHLAHAGGWKKPEPLWDLAIRTGQVTRALPFLESLLGSFGARRPSREADTANSVLPSTDSSRTESSRQSGTTLVP